jgi:hypothetical protein
LPGLARQSDPVVLTTERAVDAPAWAAPLADALLLLHAGLVLFVTIGQLLIMIGGWRGWDWIRRPMFRGAHLATISVVIAQAWLGRLCPLTIWERNLRAQAGQSTHDESFVAHWIGVWLYWDLPAWVFVVTYTAFGALVLASWYRWPPKRRR